jgi:hypothetical protein
VPRIGVAATKAANLETVFVEDLQGNRVPVITGGVTDITVFLFVRTECPISNRYVPEIRRLAEKFKPRGVRFQLVYSVATDTAAAIEDHLKAFQLPIPAVRDPSHSLAVRCGVTTTPHVAVFLADGETPAYSGRIDDRYVDFGVDRQTPTTHDLENTLEAILAGGKIAVATTPVIGCPIGEPL